MWPTTLAAAAWCSDAIGANDIGRMVWRYRQHGMATSLITVRSGPIYENGPTPIQSTEDWWRFRISIRIGFHSKQLYLMLSNNRLAKLRTFHSAYTQVAVQVSVNAFSIVLKPPVFKHFFFGFN